MDTIGEEDIYRKLAAHWFAVGLSDGLMNGGRVSIAFLFFGKKPQRTRVLP